MRSWFPRIPSNLTAPISSRPILEMLEGRQLMTAAVSALEEAAASAITMSVSHKAAAKPVHLRDISGNYAGKGSAKIGGHKLNLAATLTIQAQDANGQLTGALYAPGFGSYTFVGNYDGK